MSYFIKISFILFFLFAYLKSHSQTVTGKVYNEEKEAMPGASIYWLNTNLGTTTNETGEFQITKPELSDKLVISFVGYQSDTLSIKNQPFLEIILQKSTQLNEVVVESNQQDAYISHISPMKTEVITAHELTKAACCDLSGCFETQVSVQPQTTNVITNSKELRILGLSGTYNQILIDGMPLIQGLSYTYGISSFPGILVQNIFISKGANSVLQGYESISGQINVIPKSGSTKEKLLVNLYMNSFAEKHANVNYSFNGKKWNNITSVHTVFPAQKFDRDKDQFLDLPLLNRQAIYNKFTWKSESEQGFSSTIGIRLLHEKRQGGQTFFDETKDLGTTNTYGQLVEINQPEIYTKSGYRWNDDHKVTLIASAFSQNQDSWFGSLHYKAKQFNAYANLQYELKWKEKHELKTGFSYRHMELFENIQFADTLLDRNYAGNYSKNENIPGVFAENTFKLMDNRMNLITGVRADWHPTFGLITTPRILIKYNINDENTIRISAGTGWRTVNLFSENINLLASSRNVVFVETLNPEKATNWGLNYTYDYEANHISGYITADFYQTLFQNQFFPDYDKDPAQAYIYNYTGQSISNGFQIEANAKLYKWVDVKLAYNYLDVYRMNNATKYVLPFNPKHKILSTFSVKPKSEKWHLDINIHWYGKQNLPVNAESVTPGQSKPYQLYNIQYTQKIKRFEVYAGCENIFDFRQRQPIISWQNPFSKSFDTSSVWGPTRGRELYIGLRFLLLKK